MQLAAGTGIFSPEFHVAEHDEINKTRALVTSRREDALQKGNTRGKNSIRSSFFPDHATSRILAGTEQLPGGSRDPVREQKAVRWKNV